MQLFLSITFICMVVVIFALLGINKDSVTALLESFGGNSNLKNLIGEGKKNKLLTSIKEIQLAMKITGQIGGVYTIFTTSFLLIFVGLFSGISFNNIFLAPILAIALAALPFLYVRFQYIDYKDMLADSMKSALSVISSSYERCENILQAFKENTDIIDEPLKRVFQAFVFEVEHNGVNMETAIKTMKEKISHDIFHTWCDCLLDCAKDRNQKSRLYPIVERIDVLKKKTLKARTAMHDSLNDFKGVAIFTLIFMAMSYYFIPESLLGAAKIPSLDFLFAIDLSVLLFFTFKAILLTKDLSLETSVKKGD